MKNNQTQTIALSFNNLMKFGVITLLSLLLLASINVFAKGDTNVDENSLAISGYDPVAYFVSSEAQKGKVEFSHNYKGNKWQFVNEKNKQAFIKNPIAYLPQYGGFCAFAASKGQIAPIDPKAWTIHNNKLYLNYSLNVRSIWKPEIDENIAKADANWPTLIDTIPSK